MAETLVLPDTDTDGEFAETLVMNAESQAEEKLRNALESMQAQVEKYQYAVAEAETIKAVGSDRVMVAAVETQPLLSLTWYG